MCGCVLDGKIGEFVSIFLEDDSDMLDEDKGSGDETVIGRTHTGHIQDTYRA